MAAVKIAHITTIDSGIFTLILNKLLSLQSEGYDVTTISSPGPFVQDIEATGLKHIAVPMTRNMTPIQDIKSVLHLTRVLRQGQFSLVHTHNPKPGLFGQLAAHLADIPVIVNTVHGYYFHEFMPAWKQEFYVRMERLAAGFSDAIFFKSPEDAHTALQRRIANETQVKFLGNGIDILTFDPTRVNHNVVADKRQALGIPEGVPVIGFVGRLVAEKGILDLLAAAQTIRQRFPSARLLIVGPVDGEKADAVTPDDAHTYGVADMCVFTGMRKDVRDLYAMMDMLVLPSYREGFPRTLMEAAAMALPTVATNVRGCREAVEHERSGLLVPHRDPSALADAITTILESPRMAHMMGAEGRRMAERRFDESLLFEQVKDVYRQLLTARGITPPRPVRFAPALAS